MQAVSYRRDMLATFSSCHRDFYSSATIRMYHLRFKKEWVPALVLWQWVCLLRQ